MTPKEKAAAMAEAVKFCLRKGLFKEEEMRRMQGNRDYQKEMGFRAMVRKDLYLKAHPDETR